MNFTDPESLGMSWCLILPFFPHPATQSRVSPNVPNDTLLNGSGKILQKTHHLTFPSSKNNSEPPKNLIDLTVNSAYLTAVGSFITILGKDALHQWDSEQRRVLEGQNIMGTRWHLLGGLHLVMLRKYMSYISMYAHYIMIVYDNYDIGNDMAIWYLVIYNCSRYMFEVTQAALHDRWLKSYRISFHMYPNWWPVLYMTQQQGPGAIERSELGDEHPWFSQM